MMIIWFCKSLHSVTEIWYIITVFGSNSLSCYQLHRQNFVSVKRVKIIWFMVFPVTTYLLPLLTVSFFHHYFQDSQDSKRRSEPTQSWYIFLSRHSTERLADFHKKPQHLASWGPEPPKALQSTRSQKIQTRVYSLKWRVSANKRGDPPEQFNDVLPAFHILSVNGSNELVSVTLTDDIIQSYASTRPLRKSWNLDSPGKLLQVWNKAEH